MSVAARLQQPGTEAALGNLASRTKGLERQTRGHLIYVGTYPTDPNTTPESPPFQNAWANVGGNAPPLAFCMGVDGYVRIEGTCEGGVEGTVVFTLPQGYRPDESQRFPGSVASGSDISTWQVDPNGAVTLVARGYNPGSGGLSEGVLAAGPDGTVLTSAGGVAVWELPPVWLVGTGAPSSGLGVNDDLYLNTANGDYYQKVSGAWVLRGNLTGPTGAAGAPGAAGAKWYTGTTVPSGGLGADGDMYLRTSTGDIYQKAGGSWGSVLENIVGPTGATGATGAAGDSGQVWDGQVFDRQLASNQLGNLGLHGTNVTIYASLMRGKVPTGTILSHIGWVNPLAASGTAAPTYFAICDSGGVILAATGDISANMLGTGFKYADFLATWTVSAAEEIYFVWLQNGHWGVSEPAFAAAPSYNVNIDVNLTTGSGLLQTSYNGNGATPSPFPASLVVGNTLPLASMSSRGVILWGYVW